MMEGSTQRERDLEQESLEQRRYAFLEQLYLLTGENCEHAVSLGEVEAQLAISAAVRLPELEDLVRLGYVQDAGAGGKICITQKGIEYLQSDAWRRRSIRD
ncbi:MAG TPA: hypothetical protein VGR27_13255 [Longimicrobiaceae bacterium]|nr:hypothetical protein [Longimicrobiaceae bacterium]